MAQPRAPLSHRSLAHDCSRSSLAIASTVSTAPLQRIHGNYVEGVSSAITFLLMGGLVYPRVSASAAAAYMLGREVFAAGYSKKGPEGRLYGAIILDLALLVMLGSAVGAGWRVAGVSKLLGF